MTFMKDCLVCTNEFEVVSLLESDNFEFCSLECYYEYVDDQPDYMRDNSSGQIEYLGKDDFVE